MALTNKAKVDAQVGDVGNAGAPVPAKGTKTTANTEVMTIGTAELASMTEEQRKALGSKSSTLHFQHLLGLQSKKATRVGKGRQSYATFKPVGMTLVSDESISVPVIDVLKDNQTGIDPEKDITYKVVKAGESFDITYYEYMFLILRDEYAGFCSREGDPRGVFFSPKMPAFWRGEAKLPTPTANFTKEGSAKENMIAIDVQDPDGRWVVKPEYAEKFGALMKKAAPRRAAGKKGSTPTPMVVAVALKKILNLK